MYMPIQTQISLITLGHARHMALADLRASHSKADRRNRKRALREIDKRVRQMIRSIATSEP